MTYTNYYGVECAKCGNFIPVNSYTTEQSNGKTDVTLSQELTCGSCQHKRIYRNEDLVFSRSKEFMVPLGRAQTSSV